ncbi:unnamed protein product [Spirodela intermedia]|uniref:Uncharacterized protein n=1 Tax=Spirodela intermedia TaxID=51605 RepID=A0A7I8L3W3_SPIIN|nr:unnamed protein product [Spirodela intermedia]
MPASGAEENREVVTHKGRKTYGEREREREREMEDRWIYG